MDFASRQAGYVLGKINNPLLCLTPNRFLFLFDSTVFLVKPYIN